MANDKRAKYRKRKMKPFVKTNFFIKELYQKKTFSFLGF